MRRSYLTLVGVCTFWGTIPLVVKNVRLDAVAIVAVRLWVASVGLGVALVLRRKTVAGRKLLSFRPSLCVASAVTLAVHWFCLFAAYKRAPAGTVILIVYLAPVGIAAVAPRLLGEVLGRRTILALAAAAGGFLLVAAPAVSGASTSTTGLLLAVAAAASFVVLVVVSKPLAVAYGGLRLAFMEMTGAGLVLLPLAMTTPWGRPQPAWLWLVVLGLAHTAIGTGLYLAALGRVPATHVGILGYLEPASVVGCGWLFLHQRPGWATVLGGAMIVAAGAIVLAPGAPVAEVAVAGR